jgi:hypothetical protein
VDTCRGRPFGHPELMFPVSVWPSGVDVSSERGWRQRRQVCVPVIFLCVVDTLLGEVMVGAFSRSL